MPHLPSRLPALLHNSSSHSTFAHPPEFENVMCMHKVLGACSHYIFQNGHYIPPSQMYFSYGEVGIYMLPPREFGWACGSGGNDPTWLLQLDCKRQHSFCLIFWGHTLLGLSHHGVREPRPHTKGTCRCLSGHSQQKSQPTAAITCQTCAGRRPSRIQAQGSSYLQVLSLPSQRPKRQGPEISFPCMSVLTSESKVSKSIIKLLLYATKFWGGIKNRLFQEHQDVNE